MSAKLLITPNNGSTTPGQDPTIKFQGTGNTTDITLRVTASGALSVEGTSGQLFGISDSMVGSIFSVNDISGIPSIEVLDTGLVKLAQYNGNVQIGSSVNNGGLNVFGQISATSYGPISTSVITFGGSQGTINNQFYTANVLRGSVYADAAGIGLMNNSGGWALRVDYGSNNVNISGNVTANNFYGMVYSDTINSLVANDWLELCYTQGLGVRIGTGNGSLPLYAGSLYDAGNRVYSASNPQVNISGSAENATYLWATTHIGTYYVSNSWTGTYWRMASNHSAGVSVYHADIATNMDYGGLTGTVPTWNQNTTGNAATATTATTLSGDQTNWATNRSSAVANMLGWKHYGNNHVIFDASTGTSPTGSVVNNTNSQLAWSSTYPTLMGWNGGETYGVRVDSARIADVSSSCTGNTNGVVIRSARTDAVYYPFVWNNHAVAGDTLLYSSNNATIRSSDGAINCGPLVSTGDITAFSDLRLKSNIKTLIGSLNRVCQMRGVEYDMNNKHNIGVIAQEMQLLRPEVVYEAADENKTLSVAYGNIIAELIEAIKELKSEVDILKGVK